MLQYLIPLYHQRFGIQRYADTCSNISDKAGNGAAAKEFSPMICAFDVLSV